MDDKIRGEYIVTDTLGNALSRDVMIRLFLIQEKQKEEKDYSDKKHYNRTLVHTQLHRTETNPQSFTLPPIYQYGGV